jgi:hypothetical protein
MEEHLVVVHFSVLNRVEAQVKLSQKAQHLNVTKLKNFRDFVQAEVQETKALDVFETTQESNLIA